MGKILCSTGALIGRPNNRNYRLLKPLSEQLKCDGFEFMMYNSWYKEIEELVNTLIEFNLSFPVMHSDKHIGEFVSTGEFDEAYRRFDINCKIAKEIGAESVVLHLWNGYPSDSIFQNNIKAYKQLRKISNNYNIRLLVENVICNCEDPMKHWCELQKEYPDISFVFDTKMAAFHGQDKLLYDEDYKWLWKDEHILHYHVNDYSGGLMDWGNLRTLPIGQGHIDFVKFFDYINQIGYSGNFTVEATGFDSNGMIDVEMLNKQFEYIRNALKAI